jgi:hypothetical protein
MNAGMDAAWRGQVSFGGTYKEYKMNLFVYFCDNFF